MCWYCTVFEMLKANGIDTEEATAIAVEMKVTHVLDGDYNTLEFKRLITSFAGPHGKTLLEVYRIQKGKK